jgi:hypothetical protein
LFDKAKFAKEAGMGGCFTWSLDQVCQIATTLGNFHLNRILQDDDITLQNVILAGLGK